LQRPTRGEPGFSNPKGAKRRQKFFTLSIWKFGAAGCQQGRSTTETQRHGEASEEKISLFLASPCLCVSVVNLLLFMCLPAPDWVADGTMPDYQANRALLLFVHKKQSSLIHPAPA
jgi:hypothetical protein